MLEIPAIAVGMLAVLAYQKMVSARPVSWRAMIGFAVCASYAIWTKQTIGFMLGAMTIDVWVNHRDLLRNGRIWVAAALLGVLLIPLAVLTVKMGQVNIAQSVGSAAESAAYGIRSLPRWSVANWLEYPKMLAGMNPLLLAGGVAGLVFCWRDREYRKSNIFWVAWILLWYLCFSYFANKQERFMAVGIAGFVALTMSLVERFAQRSRWVYALPVAVICFQAPAAYRAVEPGFTGVDRAVAQIAGRGAGNVVSFGAYSQVFVPFIRGLDPAPRIYALRGPRVLGASKDLDDALYRFQVRYVLEDEATEAAVRQGIEGLAASGKLALVSDTGYTVDTRWRRLRIWQNQGAVAEKMAPVPLGEGLSQIMK
jgi:hypothetical protein